MHQLHRVLLEHSFYNNLQIYFPLQKFLQYYLMLDLIKESDRTQGGHRLFSSDLIERVKLIRRLNSSGYTLRDIREMFLKDKR